MKKVAILSNYFDTFLVTGETKNSYIDCIEKLKENDIELKRVSIHHFDIHTGRFTNYVDLNSHGDFDIIYQEYTPDIIWNRSRDGSLYVYENLQKYFQIFPSYPMVCLASDKYEASLFLKEFQPKTVLLKDFIISKDIQSMFKEKVVIKPIRGNSGKGVELKTPSELLSSTDYEGLGSMYIVQEYIDFSGGIPGLTSGKHDLRVNFIGNTLVIGTLRVPKEGGFKSNVGQGGSEQLIPIKNIPSEPLHITQNLLQQLPLGEKNIGSIDFGYCLKENRWYIFEMNFSPGLFVASDSFDEQKLFTSEYFRELSNFIHNSF